NVGPTLTHRLLKGSIAIDDGTNTGCPADDQRGAPRPLGNSCDVGAVEFVPCGIIQPIVLLSPALREKVTTPNVFLDWAGPDCVKTFSVVVRKGSKSGPIVFSKTKLTQSQVTTSSLGAGRYLWRVTACVGKKCTDGFWWRFKR